MKKLISFVIVFLIVILGIVYFTYGKEFFKFIDEKKVYKVENIEVRQIDTLDGYVFFDGGIITYNNQKIAFLDYSNNKVWEFSDTEFSNSVFVTDKHIFREMENTIEVLDKHNQSYIIPEIMGSIINVSRENEKTYLIIRNKQGSNSLFVINDNNEIVVDNKVFTEKITGVSISDKSEAYSLISLNFSNGTIINNIYFNLLDDVELWKTSIEDEILIKTQVVNNNVVVIGTNNIYFFNTNGKLMWKNGIYNKILDYEISKENKSIYMLYHKGENTEVMIYNLEGKVTGIVKSPENMERLKVFNDKLYIYNDNCIYLLHSNKLDKIFEDSELSIADFLVEGNDIRILSKNKLIKGTIR